MIYLYTQHFKTYQLTLSVIRLACSQHDAFENALATLGCELISLAASVELADSVLVEDTAVVTQSFAVLTNPGFSSRSEEVSTVKEVLTRFRKTYTISHPGTLDVGDVVQTLARIESRGKKAIPVATSEIAKAEVGVTCWSVVFDRV